MAQDVLPEYYRTVDPVEALTVRVSVRRRRTVASHARRGDGLGDTLGRTGDLGGRADRTDRDSG